ncbi:MAG: nucleotidyl transferase AbiEii/AbiGii toxin family protein [Coriobacteriia bacterium]
MGLPVKDHLTRVLMDVPPHARRNVMREYLQSRVLLAMQERGAWSSLAFLGGTALRFLYLAPRFSEALDFSLEGNRDQFDFTGLLGGVSRRLEGEAYRVELKTSTKATVNKAFIRFRGIEHDVGLSPHRDQVFSVKVEVDTNPPPGAVLKMTTIQRYSALRLAHHDEASLVAGKVCAVLMREWLKGRDIYDLVWYLSNGLWPEPNEALLAGALAQAGREDLIVGQRWKAAVVQRVVTADWSKVLPDVERFLERPEDRWMLERETVLNVLKDRGWTE